MTHPTVTETTPDPEPVAHDPFIDDFSASQPEVPQTPAGTRRRIID
jgi:hypothetical protein